MTGKTHFKIGAAAYVTLVCTTSLLEKTMALSPSPGFNNCITASGILAGAIGGIVADADVRSSTINKLNPINTAGNKLIDKVFLALNIVVNSLIYTTIALLPFLLKQSLYPIAQQCGIAQKWWPKLPLLCSIVLFALFFCTKPFKALLLKCHLLPKKLNNQARLFLYRFIYIFMGLTIIILNMRTLRDPYFNCFAIILMIVPFTAHRTFTHTLEGFLFFAFAANYTLRVFGYPYLGIAATAGYFSHLWLADMLTDEGVSISYSAYLLGSKKIVRKNSMLYQLFGKKKSMGLFKVGSKKGMILESLYLILWVLLCIALICAARPEFSFL